MTTQDNPVDWYSMSDRAIAAELGSTLKQIRIQQNLTQEQAAENAGLSRSAVSEMENGRVATSLLTIIQILRALEQLQLLDSWQVSGQISHLQNKEITGRKRMRAARSTRMKKKEENEWEWL